MLGQSCVAADARASFEWVIFSDMVHLALGLGCWPILAFSFVDSDPFGWFW